MPKGLAWRMTQHKLEGPRGSEVSQGRAEEGNAEAVLSQVGEQPWRRWPAEVGRGGRCVPELGAQPLHSKARPAGAKITTAPGRGCLRQFGSSSATPGGHHNRLSADGL